MGKLASTVNGRKRRAHGLGYRNPRRREEYLQDVRKYLDFCRASSVTALSEQTLQEQLYDQE